MNANIDLCKVCTFLGTVSCVCVCVCACACVRACVRACVWFTELEDFGYTVESLLTDTPNKGHCIKYLSTMDKTKSPNINPPHQYNAIGIS